MQHAAYMHAHAGLRAVCMCWWRRFGESPTQGHGMSPVQRLCDAGWEDPTQPHQFHMVQSGAAWHRRQQAAALLVLWCSAGG